MNFVILRAEGVMSVDNATIELNTSPWIPGNVEIVTWHGDEGCGFIEYNNVPRVLTKTTALQDYVPIIDAWIVAASQLPVPLLLWQAQRIKLDTVEALYVNKRIAPYPYGGYEFDGADEAVAHMAAQVASQGLYDRVEQELIPQTDSAFSNKVTEVNTNVVGPNQSSAPTINGWIGQNANSWNGLHIDHLSSTYNTYGATGGWISYQSPPDSAWQTHVHATVFYRPVHTMIIDRSVGAGGFSTMSHITGASVAAGGNTGVLWQPLNPPSLQNVNAIVFRDALRGIINRRTDLNAIRAAKRAALQAATSIPAVLAVDVAGGW